MWLYSQRTGQLTHGGTHVGWGYSGHGAGKNETVLEDVPNVGPIPRGFYTIEVICGDDGEPVDYEGKKAPVMRLIPDSETNTFGRSGFLLHGDSISAPGTASEGCIIEDHNARVQVATSPDKDLQVTT